MIVAFPFAFGGIPHIRHIAQAHLFCRLVRKAMPTATVVQMTDEDTPGAVEGVECVRSKMTSLGQWYFEAMLNFPHDQFLRLDYDAVIRSDVSGVFDGDYDIAIAKERKGMMNNGVVFVKNREFFRAANEAYENRTNRDNWNAIQVATQLVIDDGSFRVRKLDNEVYNVIPDRRPFPAKAAILHFTDGRKQWMYECEQ